jgi:ornithine cyclodeaminase
MVRILNREQVNEALPYTDAISAIEDAFIKFNNDKAVVPQRHIIQSQFGSTLFMPARLNNYDDNGALGIKVVGVYPNNYKKNLPSVPAIVLMIDEETGVAKALMEASDLTCIRTASGSAVATKYLSRKDSKILSVFGCGAQGYAHVIAMCYVRESIEKVILWNRTTENAFNLLRNLIDKPDKRWPFRFVEQSNESQQRSIFITVETDSNKAASVADIICTTTNTKTPLFDGKNVRLGTHLNCIGSYKHDMQEVDSYLVSHAKVIADDKEHVWSESGDLRIPRNEKLINDSHILGNVGAVITNEVFRTSNNDITLYKSVGSAFMDVAVGNMVVKNAFSKNIGLDVAL